MQIASSFAKGDGWHAFAVGISMLVDKHAHSTSSKEHAIHRNKLRHEKYLFIGNIRPQPAFYFGKGHPFAVGVVFGLVFADSAQSEIT